nr:ATP-binding protein [Xanthomonas arboricola]
MEQRSAALQRFLGGYACLARLPAPRCAPLAVSDVCERVRRLLDDARILIEVERSLQLYADADQLEQVLINLLRNAIEAGGDAPVWLRAQRDGDWARIEIADEGVGLPSSDNLFVPFFTTKPGGSGIGLVLSRKILEAQGGSLALRARSDAHGTVAEIRLPLHASQDS